MEVANPVWNSKESSYVFKLSGSANFCHVSHVSPDVPFKSPVLNDAMLKSVLDMFIEKTSKHFATPLRTATILPRLKHQWISPVDTIESSYIFEWTPKEMIVKSKEFCLVWTSIAKESEPVISSEFLNLSAPSRSSSPAPESKDLRTIQLQTQTGLVEHEIPMSSDLNDPRMMTLEYHDSPHSAEKKRIREARLRAALANLRAERLTEKYYQKYGTPTEDDSSDLSSDSEDENENGNRLY